MLQGWEIVERKPLTGDEISRSLFGHTHTIQHVADMLCGDSAIWLLLEGARGPDASESV